jgi:hypothetical protein
MQRPIWFAVASALFAIALTGCEQSKSGSTPEAQPAATDKAAAPASDPPKCSDCIPVTADNFTRAETDLYFKTVATERNGFAKFEHNRTPTPMDKQTVIRMNRDTLYSGAVFDLDAGPVTIALPDSGKRFMSMQIINEDEYTPMVDYGKGTYTLTKDKIGTRYVLAAVRTLVDSENPADLNEAHGLQDAIKVTQKSPGTLEVPKWDPPSQNKVRKALLALGETLPDMKRAFGTKAEVDPVHYLIGSAAAWGGNPDKDAIYLNVTPKQNDGKTIYKLHVDKNVPVDGFWSISLYNAKGYFEQNLYNAYALNNLTAKKSPDGSVDVQFGGCDGKIANCLPIMDGWNYMVRLYRPRAEVLSGKWKFPEAQPAS